MRISKLVGGLVAMFAMLWAFYYGMFRAYSCAMSFDRLMRAREQAVKVSRP